ncbi:MAG: Holliday junction resolvase RuvX [Ruminococcus sp.]|jgi:putative Holliday junction resolvase|nr:Holliday junction resolvase RuvX [Ruminococcus sp.]
MKILSIDYGTVRTGIAICDSMEILASPYETVTETDFDTLAEKIALTAKKEKVGQIVVGYPKNMDGSTGEKAKTCELFAKKLTELTGLETVLWDERLTTVSAHKALNVTNTRGKKRKNVVDKLAAVIILDDYLRSRT